MISTRPKIYTSLRGVDKHSRWMVCMVMVLVDVLCCGGDSLEEDLRWGPRLGALVDLVEDDGVTSCGVALFKTVEALSRGAFFFSTSVELKTKGAGGGGAGREIMDSNTSFLPWILTPRHFLAVSAICLERSDLA